MLRVGAVAGYARWPVFGKSRLPHTENGRYAARHNTSSPRDRVYLLAAGKQNRIIGD